MPQWHGAGQSWFDPLAFREVTGARFGNAGFNSLRGPHLYNLDLGLFRNFAFSERFQLQFRAEAFNLTNTPHFDFARAIMSPTWFSATAGSRIWADFPRSPQ